MDNKGLKSNEAVIEKFNGIEFAKNLSQDPGVYQMFDNQGKLLYIGKAKHLKNRVGSYFNKYLEVPRTREMVGKINQIKVTITHSESEALLLEAQLIKEFQPQYNILLRTGKHAVYLGLGLSEEYPRAYYIHGQPNNPKDQFFGPFNSSYNAQKTIELLQKIFKIRTCSNQYFKSRSRPCLQYQIGLCTAPCVNLISKEEYGQNAYLAGQLLKGKNKEISQQLTLEMEKASKTMEFEKAGWFRDRIKMLSQLRQGQYVQGVSEDMDVFACSEKDSLLCVTLLPFRNGINLGSHNFYVESGIEDIEVESLENNNKNNKTENVKNSFIQFIAQHYLSNEVPAKILINNMSNSINQGINNDSNDNKKEANELLLLTDVLKKLSKAEVSINPNKNITHWQKYKDMAQKNADEALKLKLHDKKTKDTKWQALENFLKFSSNSLLQVEAYDISHHKGEATIGSSVCFGPDGAQKDKYRAFPISPAVPGDDYEAMSLLMEKRFLDTHREDLPDVLLIDGGEGQVAVVNQTIEKINQKFKNMQPSKNSLNPLIVGVRKGVERLAGEEVLIMPDGEEVKLGKNSKALQMIQNIRDEAHRFAITRQRSKLRKTRLQSIALNINGIGKKKAKLLLSHFASMEKLQKATIDELIEIKGIDKKLAGIIYEYFQKNI